MAGKFGLILELSVLKSKILKDFITFSYLLKNRLESIWEC